MLDIDASGSHKIPFKMRHCSLKPPKIEEAPNQSLWRQGKCWNSKGI